VLQARHFLGRQQCRTFGDTRSRVGAVIEHMFVINLDREPDRWSRMVDEVDSVLDASRFHLQIESLACRPWMQSALADYMVHSPLSLRHCAMIAVAGS
jgi:hypothetical protein